MRLMDRVLPRAANIEDYSDSGDLPYTAVPFIAHFIRILKLPVTVIVLCFSANSVLGTIEPYFAGWMVSILTKTEPANIWQAILPVVLLYILLCQIFMRLCANFGHAVLNRTSPVLTMLVRRRLAAYLYNHSYRYFQEDMAGRLAGKVMEMPEAVKSTVSDSLDTLIYLVFVAITSTVMFMTINAFLGIISLLYILSTILLAQWRISGFSRLSRVSASAQQTMRGRYIDGISNILLVKLFARESYERSILSATLVDAGTAEQMQGVSENRWYRLQHVLNFLMQSSIPVVALCLYRQQQLSIGQFATAVALSITLASNVWYMMHFAATFFGRFAVIDDALKTILQSHEITDAAGTVSLPAGRSDIVLDRVEFAYANRPVFKDFILELPAGQKVGLVGPSGAGKSTLMQLLLRLSDIQQGAIRIGGVDIRAVPQADLRRAITVIPQATELMHRSIRDNILYGNPDAGDERMIEAAKRAFIHETIMSLADQHGNTGYDSMVGERGVKLSGGQRQRIAIARAFLKDAPILILDEATSALDSESERLIQSSFVELFEGRTVIAIAHRLSTISHLDRIVVLDHGRIAEDGTHGALLSQNGLYSRLWALQSGGFIGND